MRTWNSGRNAAVGLLFQMWTLILNFIVRTVFVYILTSEYLGITGLFTNVLAILNLSEMGISSAIIFALYKPVAENNRGKINALMAYYRKAYFAIGCVFLFLGLLLMPFLNHLINGSTDLVNIKFVYTLYLLQTVTSYWFFAYRSAILTASQNEYIITMVSGICLIINSVIQIITLLIFRTSPELAFYLYILEGILANILTNIVVFLVVKKKYPYLNTKHQINLTKREKNNIYKNVVGLSLYKISSTVNNSAGSLIISSFISLSAVGIFSNYLLITTGVTRITAVIFNPLTASIGNMNVTESNEKREFIFRCLHLMHFWIYGFCAICLWVLMNPFIGGIWLGDQWLLSKYIVFAIMLKFLIDGLMGAVIKYREASGLYWNTKWRYIFTSMVNIGFAILFTWKFQLGVLGVLLGSILSELVIVIADPQIVYKNVFHKSAFNFYTLYLQSFVTVLVTGGIINILCIPMKSHSFTNFLMRLFLCVIITNGLWLLLYGRTPEFQYLYLSIMQLVKKFKGKLHSK